MTLTAGGTNRKIVQPSFPEVHEAARVLSTAGRRSVRRGARGLPGAPMPSDNARDMAHAVFISFATGDEPVADAVRSRLESTLALECTMAPREVNAGRFVFETSEAA